MTDERDPKVSQRYRDLPGEEPSRELDQAILAAAHRAMDKPHAPLVVPAGRHRWYFSLGAAAILILAVAVTLQVERVQPDPELVAQPAPAQPPASREQVPEAVPQSAPPVPATKAEPRMRAERRPAYAPDPPPPAAPEAKPQPAPAPEAGAMADSAQAPAKAASELRKEQAAADVAASRAPPSAPRSSAARAAAESPASTPERELERIAGLRTQGRDEEADKALAEFRKRYPDYRIPQAMLEKVERKAPAR